MNGDFWPAVAYDIIKIGVAAGGFLSLETAFHSDLASTTEYKHVGAAYNKAYGIDGINRAAGAGVVVGADNKLKTHAFYWVGTTQAIDLGTLHP